MENKDNDLKKDKIYTAKAVLRVEIERILTEEQALISKLARIHQDKRTIEKSLAMIDRQ